MARSALTFPGGFRISPPPCVDGWEIIDAHLRYERRAGTAEVGWVFALDVVHVDEWPVRGDEVELYGLKLRHLAGRARPEAHDLVADRIFGKDGARVRCELVMAATMVDVRNKRMILRPLPEETP